MVRKSELLLARWEHVDFEQAEWHIPAEHSKTGKPHIVFLSLQAVALFRELRTLAGGSELVMPGRGTLTKPFAHNAINTALKTALQGQDIPAFTIHDLRRTASTLLHENGWQSDVVEKALNHTIGGVRGVYNRAEYAPQRREMLQFWADTIEQLMTTGQVVFGRFKHVALRQLPSPIAAHLAIPAAHADAHGPQPATAGRAGIARPPVPERGPSPGIRLSRPAALDSPPRTAAALLPPGAPGRARSAWRAPPSGRGCRARTPARIGRCGSSGCAGRRWPALR